MALISLKRSRNKGYGWLFLFPFTLLFALFWFLPIIVSMYYSLTEWTGMSAPQYVGFANYRALLSDPRFVIALKNTLYYVVVYNLIVLPLALILALTLNSSIVGRWSRFFRVSYFLPVTMILVVVALVFDLIYARDIGLLDSFLRYFGFRGSTNLLYQKSTAMWAIIILRVWRTLGYYAVILFAGLQSIPGELYEASRVDGASTFRSTISITLPLLRPVILFLLVVSSIWGFQLFDEPWTLLQGGPADATLTLVQYLYQNTFLYNRLGYGAAVAYALALLMFGVSILQIRMLEHGEE